MGRECELDKLENRIKGEIVMETKAFIETYQSVPAYVVFEIDGEMNKIISKSQLIAMAGLPIHLNHLTKPSFICSFTLNGIQIFKKKKEILEISFEEIEVVEIVVSRVKVMTYRTYVSGGSNYYMANLKVKLKEGQHIYLNSLMLSDLPKVIVIFEEFGVAVNDVYDLKAVIELRGEQRGIHEFFEENLDILAEENSLDPEKKTWRKL